MYPLSQSGCLFRSCGLILGTLSGLTKLTTERISFTLPPGVPVRAKTYIYLLYFACVSSVRNQFAALM
ncbi:hypothetical protein PBCV1_a364L [Paramecium bursaria Chlorella virus 1]|uniref:Uncharacterized protein n=1 Tax=Paramecium bursaria Chlorella virus 1 TaxID=10506 RepID=Q84678_PBCV1|nr:hypothetical protein PBCV1_a364L [Paramecium bursaria Chlorella virus 1]AAC96732.1 hypothetical protein [Paramecium bursaria Chlorella virus 1]